MMQASAHATKVILIGQMGVGKSTVARLLASRWPEYAAVDLDLEIEARGRSISEVFEADGEVGFRALEADVLARVLAREDSLVVATGGGAPCQPGALARMRAAGPVVWLDAPPNVIVHRLVGSGDKRPLLAGLDVSHAERFLSRQLDQRRPYYVQADLTVDASEPPDVVATHIDRMVSRLVEPHA
jgi:shikimate kinase